MNNDNLLINFYCEFIISKQAIWICRLNNEHYWSTPFTVISVWNVIEIINFGNNSFFQSLMYWRNRSINLFCIYLVNKICYIINNNFINIIKNKRLPTLRQRNDWNQLSSDYDQRNIIENNVYLMMLNIIPFKVKRLIQQMFIL